ncbi:MAG: ferrous iron transport protein B [Desulfomicrobium sp.]|nr:ferrous iron transport protein B [Pseudomonadota bacterium]MBV1711536.1 ferrous iron transport protein B [Desulfomicrobium sp.]MBU4572949.1 ferrous iron transport protein B [Pseudomonadota bacterium]MBU4594677.1 ferrous iron transport protein B [Pseudomonadota bacterium]MBV1718813.1 ferrous iron transport protein B [Desulfomicrobium sp.]
MSEAVIATIALAGNPNAGKTTLFNALTGARQHVGNYPGITVEKKEGFVDTPHGPTRVVDLPGTYSLTAYSQEELVARDFLIHERPQGVINVLDATSLERNLYLTVQFLELGIPVTLALNMVDALEAKGMRIDSDQLGSLMNVPVVRTVARSGQGVRDALAAALDHPQKSWRPLHISYGPDLDPVLQEMTELIIGRGFLTDTYPPRWLALKFLESDLVVRQLFEADAELSRRMRDMADEVARHCEKTLKTQPEFIVADYRYGYISSILRQGVLTIMPDLQNRADLSDKIDSVLTHQVAGPVIMLGILYGLFSVTFTIGQVPMGWVESFFSWLASVASGLPEGLSRSLVVDGIIAGVGGVLGFVPLILIMFMGITFLEDSGYMARMAYMLDRVFRSFGLHGSSVVPFIISGGIPGGCAVPGVMAARTLRSPKEKLATLLTAPFMVCGAKVPVFILLSAAFFPEHGARVMFLITLGGWAAALVVAKLLRSSVIRGPSTPFVMELPPYRMPTAMGLVLHTWERGWQYIKKAGTVILAISILVWAMMTFPALSPELAAPIESQIESLETRLAVEPHEEIRLALDNDIAELNLRLKEETLANSLAGRMGRSIEHVTSWAGFDWRTNIALLGGIAAKEVIVSTLATAHSLSDGEEQNFSSRIATAAGWNTSVAISLMIFVLLYSPCFVTVIAIAREASWAWAAFSVVFNTGFAFALAVATYQLGIRMGW